jgi:hypothetical protein
MERRITESGECGSNNARKGEKAEATELIMMNEECSLIDNENINSREREV